MDTCTRSELAFPPHTHLKQGIIPFSSIQSLKICVPFQCYSVCVVRINQPSRSLSEVPHTLDLSEKLPLPLLTNLDQIKDYNNSDQGKSVPTAKYQLLVQIIFMCFIASCSTKMFHNSCVPELLTQHKYK